MVSVLGVTNAKSSWVCRWNRLHKNKPGVYAIDAKGEVNFIRDQNRGGDNSDYEEDDDEGEYENATQRDEREVNVKREKIMNH